MQRKHNEKLVPLGKALRNNMTKEERHLWYDYLRNYPVRFTRQKVLANYIADFYCAKAKLAIELDGSQHYTKEGLEKDEERTAFLNKYGIVVLRIPNGNIENDFYGICKYIDNVVKERLAYPEPAGNYAKGDEQSSNL